MGSFGGSSPKVKESQTDKELARIRDEERADYLRRFAPHEERMIAETQAFDTEGHREAQRDIAGSTVMQRLTGPGVGAGADPGSGRVSSAMGAGAVARGAGAGAAMTASDIQSTGTYMDRLARLIEMGKGVQYQGISGLNRAAGMQLSRDIAEAQARGLEQEAYGEAVGTAAGLGVSGYLRREKDPPMKLGAGTIEPAPSMAHQQVGTLPFDYGREYARGYGIGSRRR